MKKRLKIMAALAAVLLAVGLCACSTGTPAASGAADAGTTQTETAGGTDAGKETIETEIPNGTPGETPPPKPEGEEGPETGGTPPEKPGGEDTDSPEGTPPEKPDGEGGNGPGGTPHEKPDGGDSKGPGGTPPEKPDGGDGKGPGGTPPGKPGGNAPGGAPGGNAAAAEASGATEIGSGETQSGQTYDSTKTDENALLISTSEKVTLTDPEVTKSGDSDGGDSCNFYGLNAAVLVQGGSETTITGGTVTSDADGANGVFCYGGNGGQNGAEGDGTTVILRGTVIKTTGNGSGGIMTTGGGATYAYDLDVTTSGRSSAAIRTDRGGGTVVIEGGTYTSGGLGSPAIYSTADITVTGARLVSNLSEGVVIEGLNSVTLTDCDLTADNTQRNGNANFLDSVMIYQSMSGDADSGTGRFTMTGGSLTSRSGHVFHVTNTHAVLTLEGVEITNEDPEGILLSVCADGWSGGTHAAELKAVSQKLAGAVKVGSDASLVLDLSDGSVFEGSIDGKITDAGGKTVSAETGTVSVTLDSTSTWILTGDSYVSEFHGSAANVTGNGYTLYVNGTALAGTK